MIPPGGEIETVATLTAAPAHEIGHALSEQDIGFNNASNWLDLFGETARLFGHHLKKGSVSERMAMLTGLKTISVAQKHGVML